MQDKHGTWYAILSIRKEKHFVRCDSKEQTLYQRATLEKILWSDHQGIFRKERKWRKRKMKYEYKVIRDGSQES